MNKTLVRISALAAGLATAALLLACASTGPGQSRATGPGKPASTGGVAQAGDFPLAAAGSSLGAGGLSAFAKESLASFSTFTLSNGLPVIVKRNSANRVQHISLVIRGGSAAADPAAAGLEALALKVMARGSAAYSYEDIQSLLDETSSGIGSSSSFDYSAYSLTTLDKYFARLFPVWVDTLVRPAFRQADFDQELSQAKLALQAKEQNPWSKTGLEMNRILFAGHPYGASPDGTRESLETISLQGARDWYAARVAASSLFVVAVGDFDPAALRADLEAGLGKLPPSGAPLPPAPPALELSGRGSLAKVDFPQSKGMGYLRGDFAAPAPTEADFMPLNLGMKILSELLFNVVRDKHGAVYSPGSYIRSFNANYGSITLFKTKNPGPAKAYVDEAVAILAAGKAVAVDPGKSADGFAPLAEVLEATKATYINELYASQATNGAVAGRIAQSVVSTGDYRSYLLDVDRIGAVTGEQIGAALDRYLLKGKIAWVALGSADVLIGAQEGDFENFAAAR
jgi:zinc protease